MDSRFDLPMELANSVALSKPLDVRKVVNFLYLSLMILLYRSLNAIVSSCDQPLRCRQGLWSALSAPGLGQPGQPAFAVRWAFRPTRAYRPSDQPQQGPRGPTA